LQEFNLVGGTALALRIGHRISIDIDLFSTNSFNAPEVANHLKTAYDASQPRTLSNAVFCFINDIKIDLISHQYPLVADIDVIEGIRMVSLEDIGAMKLNAIYGNGTRLKDFVDMYFLLEKFSLNELLQACHQKYPDINPGMAKQALIHHQDIDFNTPIHYTGTEIKWPAVAERLKKAYQNLHISFAIPDITRKLLAKKRTQDQGRRNRPKL
jgi:hypothetical protein